MTSVSRRLRLSGMTLLLVGALSLASSNVNAQALSKDETAIRTLPARMAAGWNKGSGEAFAAQFAENADYVVVNGSHVSGRAEIGTTHQRIFDTFYKGTRLWIEIKSVRFLQPDVALMHSVSSVLMPGESEKPDRPKAIQSFVVIKKGDAWLIESFHNTPIQPPGPPQTR